MTSITEAVALVREQAAAEQAQAAMSASIDPDLLEIVLAAAERAEQAVKDAEAWHEQTLRFVDLAFVDPGADAPVTWQDRAHEIEGLVMGQVYQIVGHLFVALDDPSFRPSEADEIKLKDYLAAGKYDDEFLPWPKGE